jgi:cyclopropane-fatty-acyl-phospholipid synthase
MLLSLMLKSLIRKGSLCLIDGRGRSHRIGDGSPTGLTIRLASRWANYRMAWNPALSLGEGYMNGHLIVEEGSLYDFLDLLARNLDGSHERNLLLRLTARVVTGMAQRNPVRQARRNVAHHYDLSARLYDLFLDADRQYSCAYFQHPEESLEQAQQNKKLHIAAKLLLNRPQLRILDIGCGWGGLAIDLARISDGMVTGVTLSTEQHRACQERARAAGLQDRVQFHLLDYRAVEGKFDRIVSVGMFEHVGKKNYSEFFSKLRDLLTDDGVALLHSIGYSDAPGAISPFIRKYIFPGADLPSLSEVFPVVEKSALFCTDVEVLRLHYAETLRHWRHRFMERTAEVASIYDQRFCRMWEFYLVLCELAFRRRTSMVFQMQVAKRVDTVPLTRNYMYASV